jgi:hypothetical protein
MRRPPLLLLVALAGALPYLGLLGADFLGLDDPYFITRLRLWTDPSPAAAWEVVAGPVHGAWHPLHQLSYLVDRLVWGPTAFGVRLGQALLHGGCAAAVAWLARRLGLAPVAAAVAGLVFAWHPAHAENVGWPSQRKDLLSCLFLLLALGSWHDGQGRVRGRLATLGWLALSLLSKSSGSVAVPMLAASSLAQGRLRRDAPWLAAGLALALGATGVHFVAQRSLGATQSPRPPAEHARRVLRAADYYAVTAVVPIGLSIAPPDPGGTPLGARDARAALLAAGVAAALVVGWRRRRRQALLLAWAFLALGPIVGLVPLPTFVQDRYLLVPTVGLSLLAGDLVAGLGRRPSRRARTLIATGALLVTLAALSARASHCWSDTLALWRHAVEVTPRSPTALARLAEATYDEAARTRDPARLAEAERLARAALALAPAHPMSHAILADALAARGAGAEARLHLEAVAASGWNLAHQSAVKLVLLDLDADDLAAARNHLAVVRRLAPPGDPEADSVAAQVALAEGRPAEAAAALRSVVEVTPWWAEAWGRLADVERLAGGEVEPALARADPDQAAAVRAHLALDAGRLDEAATLLARGQTTLAGDVAALRLAVARSGAPDAARLLAEAERRHGPLLRRRARLEADLRALLGE